MAVSRLKCCVFPYLVSYLAQDVNNGAWNITRQHLHSPETIRAWAVVDYSIRLDPEVIKRFTQALEQCCTARGKAVY